MASPWKLLPNVQASLYLFSLIFFSAFTSSLPIRFTDLNRPSNPNSIPDVHDLLPVFGFPKGLLPSNAIDYSLSSDGTFTVHLSHPCYVQFDQLVYYDKKIEGKLTFGSVSDVSGIQAKKLFLWVSVTGIKSDAISGMIEFNAGAFWEKLPAHQFENIPNCKNKGCQESHLESI